MPSARLLTGPPEAEFRADGMRVLARDLAVDLGERMKELEAWDIGYEGRKLGVGWRVSEGIYNTSVYVYAGLVYDGASLPAGLLVRALAGPKERYEAAAVFHDALYQAQAPRAAADRVFWLVARSGKQNVGRFRGYVTWAALRLFGWRAWRSYDRT